MNTQKVIEILNTPEINQVNKLKARSAMKKYKLDNTPLNINLDGEYYFKYCLDIESRDELFYQNYNQFDKVIVPSVVELNGYGQLQYVNTQYPWDGRENNNIYSSVMKMNYASQYVKEFKFIKDINESYYLSFEGVESSFNVWVNDQYVGYNEDSFTTTEFDITNLLQDGNNTLAVEVYKFNVGSWLNDQDFWRLSGIFRSVSINTISTNSIIDYFIEYDLDIKSRKVNLKIALEKNKKFNCEYQILDNDKIICKGNTEENIQVKLENIKLWNPENPYLYTLVLRTPTEIINKRIGFRKIEIKDSIIYFNGVNLNIKGVNRHEFSSRTARTLSYQDILNDLVLLKKMNVNAIRTSHYPNSNDFYDLCDELGFIVMDEVNLETHGSWMIDGKLTKSDNILPSDNNRYEDRVIERAKNMFYRDRNNTCVLFYSLGNESYSGQILLEMQRFLKTSDSSRLIHYEGVFWDRSILEISDIESQMYTSSENIEQFIKKNSDKPFILCEFSHAMGNSNGNFADYINLREKYNNYHGGFIWEYIEQLIYRNGKYNYGGDFGDRPTDGEFICDGIISDYEHNTPEAKYIANMYSPIIIKEKETTLEVINTNMFESLTNIRVDIIESTIRVDKLISSFKINIKDKLSLNKINMNNIVYKFYSENILLKEYSYNEKGSDSLVNYASEDARFIDGDNNFGIISKDFEVLFSKTKNNIISLKYNKREIFSDMFTTFEPNFYRAVTSNDIGAAKDKELGILKYISNCYKTKIIKYCFEKDILNIQINYQSDNVFNYESIIDYQVKLNGDITLKLKLLKSPTSELFNYGFKTTLNKEFIKCIYFGNGPYDTYADRKSDIAKAYYHEDIDKKIPYVYPQEYGNRTEVDEIYVLDDNNKGFKIMLDNGEFSLKLYSDNQLDEKKNVNYLIKENPFLRINKIQTGVGGDDSWGSWCKDKYIVNSKEYNEFEIKISKI